ncbi:MAG TPA: class I SAM-dependent methyltransferase [Pyrinomonadaceae bacterium]|nr:class I SAM-dependent methyltransferase [Pyrinomonadaceae bacterium]
MKQNTKSFIRSNFPASVPIYNWIRSLRSSFKTPGLEEVFSDIYLNNSWADQESVSGPGSTMTRTENVRRELPGLLESIGATSLLDAACGDFNWMRHTDLLGIEYLGVDIVPQLIARNQQLHGDRNRKFLILDITRDALPRTDVILCRDCLIHLCFDDGRAAVENFKSSGSAFLLATTHPTVTENLAIASGGWRNLNLQLQPYNFPAPRRLIIEEAERGKHLGLWHLQDVA